MSKSMAKTNGMGPQEKDTNIQVVVRCRESPTRSLKSNTSIVVHPVHGQDVKIDGPASVARGYHYDAVFGPKATQEHIYEQIVSPILNEVMQGYNCTIFAYGQTGTGKTYTMEGDLDIQPSPSMPSTPAFSRQQSASDVLSSARISQRAGVIPRTLYNLFYALDKQSAEFYVRVSYVELYNEELRDLLSEYDGGSHLKVYESGTDKGVIIQGLEEKIVSSAKEAVALMQAGAMRRKVAATRCNDASSRSHAIFTVTVFIRERAVTAEGEDIVKLGKLNLVDLAGSENIGRSGAQNMRAWEAGSINKSLLVLGRVISALVERNSYVPYRDSKLTYILKDSLGGRTRTCMIATISSSADNIEETVKTLQYASQAKGIRNRPVANKKVSKSEIVHDMQHQIEQLRRDLEAARDGSGFYVTKESYDQLVADKKIYTEQVDEWRQRVLIYEEQVAQLTAQATLQAAAQTRLETQLDDTQQALEQANQMCAQTADELSKQTVLTNAHKYHELQLDNKARSLHGALGAAAEDAEGLHQKIRRMGDNEQKNLDAVNDINSTVVRETANVGAALKEHAQKSEQQVAMVSEVLGRRVGDAFDMVARAMLKHGEELKEQLEAVTASADAQQKEAVAGCENATNTLASILQALEANAQRLQQQCTDACQELQNSVQQTNQQQADVLDQMIQGVNKLLAMHSAEAQARYGDAEQLAQEILAQVDKESAEMQQRHRQELVSLQQQVDEMRANAVAADEEILATVNRMLTERRQREHGVGEKMLAAAQVHKEGATESVARVRVHCETLGRDAGRLAQKVGVDAGACADAVAECLAANVRDAAQHATIQMQNAGTHANAMAEAASGSVAAAVDARETGVAQADELRRGIGALGHIVTESLGESTKASEHVLCQVQETAGQATGTWQEAHTELQGLLQAQQTVSQQAAQLISSQVTAISDVVSSTAQTIKATETGGSTPTRRSYQTVDRWSVTQRHIDILARLKQLAENNEPVPESLEWTGISVQPTDQRPLDLLDSPTSEMHEGGMDTPVSATSVQTLADGGVPALRKRLSDSVVASDAEMLPPPARKPKTRGSVDPDEAMEVESGIPRPASRIQAPRRTRRTRG
ncbi:hypothetical protein FB645_003074 [Coemansia sp. IMI 203386]|nr:hypothetical protein FB645_003074 [Coemansia sp. IMI 203386]